MSITHADVLRHVHYDPDTGVFWRKSTGQPTGRVKGGYVYVRVVRKEYQAHRLATFYMTGHMPSADVEIDHKNSNALDNRWDNLQPLTRRENRLKRRTPTSYRRAPAPYVYPSRKKPGAYEAFVMWQGRKLCCGSAHPTIEAAIIAQHHKTWTLMGEMF